MRQIVIARFFALLLLAGGLFALPALAQTNPLTGAPAPREQAQPVRELAKPGLLAQVAREMYQLQARMNKALAGQMRAIRDGRGLSAIAGSLAAGMALAFLYGALHVAGPGHGKAVIVSYFLGREAKLSRGLWLGLQIAATHVVAAILLVWVADVALRQAFGGAPAELRAVQAVSYGAIIAIGLHMLWQAVRRLRGEAVAACGHDHGHSHTHDHGHDHGRERARQGVLSFAVGLVPCTGATLVMLYALANGIVYAGIVMVLAIGLGMAAAMAIIGVATILARRAALARLPGAGGDGRWASVLPGALQGFGGFAISLLGGLMLYAALTGGPLAS
jgi:ABC-type nickel/cobalt efflux system permease component RcnA